MSALNIKPNPHDEIRRASFSLPPGMRCDCGANVLRWTDRGEGRATCNGCGEQWILTGAGGCIEAMAIDPNAWHEAYELAALERLFEIGIAVLRAQGLAFEHMARNLATRAVSTRQEFTTSLSSVAGFDRARIAIEVANVYRVVAERRSR